MKITNRPFAGVTLPMCAVILLAGAGFARAGDLNPPAGPVAQTYKTLTEVEPRTAVSATNTPGDADSIFKISVPGSYYLAGNIFGEAGKHGVEITATGVTLDLNGFDLRGVPAMGAFDGVSVTATGLKNIAVVNGSVRDWGDEGVDIGTSGAINCRVADLLVTGNAGSGISTASGSTVSNCSAYSNTANGINVSFGCIVTTCTAYLNTGHGISTSSGSTVSSCTVYANGGIGISVSSGCSVADCSATTNTGNGIGTGTECTVSNSAAESNGGIGINADNGCQVTQCIASGSTMDGIRVAGDCLVRGNFSYGNFAGDGAGIHATATDNRIEGNTCNDNDRGIDVDVAGNMIIKNTCAGNSTNWDIAAGNVCLVVQGVTGGAVILGNTGGTAPGSTDPNVNFTY